MSFLTATTFDVTNDELIDVMTSGIAWDVGEDRVISWAVADGLRDDWDNREEAVQQFGDALATIEAFIDISFQYAGAFDSPVVAGDAGADIVYTLDNNASETTTLAYAYYPGPGVFADFFDYDSEDGDIFMNFDADIIASSSFAPGSDGFVTIIHEIGHALGLKHPFEEDRGRPEMANLTRTDIRDVDFFTLMSYTDPYEAELERWDPATPMLLDVLALQFMYGVNDSTNAGNTTHVLANQEFYSSIWDASGVDRVDASNLSEGWRVDLPNIQDTPLVDTLSGFAIPLSQLGESLVGSNPTELFWLLGDIENLTGTGFNDDLRGNALGNDIRGGAGNDEIEGHAGNDLLIGDGGSDTAFFAGSQSNYTLSFGPSGTVITDRRPDGTGTDTLVNVETLSFYGGDTLETIDLVRFGNAASLSPEDMSAFIELYIAYFDRAPDAEGLNFWATSFANGVTLEQSARLFVDQPETRERYPETLSNTDFAIAVYDNVLGRTPDEEGLNFWIEKLDTGLVRDEFILRVLEGAKADPDPTLGQRFIDQQLEDRAYLSNKSDIGALYAVHRGLTDADDAKAVMALYTGSDASIDQAVAAIDQLYAAALDAEDGAFLMPIIGVLENPFDLVA